MENIRELVSIVTKHKVKDLPIIESHRGDKASEFYNLVVSGELQNDYEAARHFYSAEPSHPQYRRLKNRLRERLLNSVVFIDANDSKFSNAQNAFYNCQRYLVIVRILLGRYATGPAISLCEKILVIAVKYEIYDVARDTASILREHHAFRTGNQRQFTKYKKLAREYSNIINAEIKAQEYYEELAINLVRSSIPDNSYFSLGELALRELNPIAEKVQSFKFHLVLNWIKVNLPLQKRAYGVVLERCDLALRFFNSKKDVPPHFVGQFRYWKLLAYVCLGDIRGSRESYQECSAIFEKGTVRWYNTNDLYFIHLMRIGKYDLALQIYLDTTSNDSYKFQTKKRHETHRKYSAYLYYLALKGKLSEITMRTFRLRKFLNEIPIFSQDKRGYNITVLIIQILILLQQKKYDQLTDRIEAIEKYTSRYLRNDENFRSNCFIKMLLQIPKRNFHRVAVLRHAKPYIKRLATVPLEKSKQSYEIEIIPYEHLWEYALESLR